MPKTTSTPTSSSERTTDAAPVRYSTGLAAGGAGAGDRAVAERNDCLAAFGDAALRHRNLLFSELMRVLSMRFDWWSIRVGCCRLGNCGQDNKKPLVTGR